MNERKRWWGSVAYYKYMKLAKMELQLEFCGLNTDSIFLGNLRERGNHGWGWGWGWGWLRCQDPKSVPGFSTRRLSSHHKSPPGFLRHAVDYLPPHSTPFLLPLPPLYTPLRARHFTLAHGLPFPRSPTLLPSRRKSHLPFSAPHPQTPHPLHNSRLRSPYHSRVNSKRVPQLQPPRRWLPSPRQTLLPLCSRFAQASCLGRRHACAPSSRTPNNRLPKPRSLYLCSVSSRGCRWDCRSPLHQIMGIHLQKCCWWWLGFASRIAAQPRQGSGQGPKWLRLRVHLPTGVVGLGFFLEPSPW